MIWDDGDIVAQCFYDAAAWSSCPSWSFPVEGLADYDGSSRITVLDRGVTGQISDLHDASGFSGMTLVGRPSRVMTNRSIAPAPDSGTGLSLSSLPMHKTAPDGWTFDNNTWQGVRTMDASLGTWTTPDAYAGNVHDPMSQKPFMWNHNNSFDYEDPSGYCAGVLTVPCAIVGAAVAGTEAAAAAASAAVGGVFVLAVGGFVLATTAPAGEPPSGTATKPSTLAPGPHAAEGTPGTRGKRPTKAQQGAINEEGNTHGCHTCGATTPGTRSGNWVGDHQPPSSQNPNEDARLYPHCTSCSARQGGEVRGGTRE
jgi:hypothetical protein